MLNIADRQTSVIMVLRVMLVNGNQYLAIIRINHQVKSLEVITLKHLKQPTGHNLSNKSSTLPKHKSLHDSDN